MLTKKRKRTRAATEHDAWKRSPGRRDSLESARVYTRILPPRALELYREMVGSYLGKNLDEVIAFALIAWLSAHHGHRYPNGEV